MSSKVQTTPTQWRAQERDSWWGGRGEWSEGEPNLINDLKKQNKKNPGISEKNVTLGIYLLDDILIGGQLRHTKTSSLLTTLWCDVVVFPLLFYS